MLQNRGHLTAMTGDGVNDAPSLKRADCGIAVEGASDAARSAADVVFLDEGLSTIITSIKVARQIFHRMKGKLSYTSSNFVSSTYQLNGVAYIVYRIALCLHLEIYLTISMIVLNETIRADLIVFIALFADLGTIAIAYDNAPHAKAPVEWQLPKIWIMSTILGALLAAGSYTVLLRILPSVTNHAFRNLDLERHLVLESGWEQRRTHRQLGIRTRNPLPRGILDRGDYQLLYSPALTSHLPSRSFFLRTG